MKAPACFATSGMISGTGFAIAKMQHYFPIVFTHSGLKTFGALTPIKISAPKRTSCKLPYIFCLFVNRASLSFSGFMFCGLPS